MFYHTEFTLSSQSCSVKLDQKVWILISQLIKIYTVLKGGYKFCKCNVHSAFIRLKWVDKVVMTHVKEKSKKKFGYDNFKMVIDTDR